VDEDTPFADWLAEAALAHAKGDKVEAAYKRGDALVRSRPTANYGATGLVNGLVEIEAARIVPQARL
jgi:hypothetical protein